MSIPSMMWAGQHVTGRGHTRLNQDKPDAETAKRQHEAWEKGGLRAAAINGRYRLTVDPHHGINAGTLEFLVQHSKVVVVGQIVSRRCWMTSKGETITTDYEVAVELTRKGAFRPADRLTMSVLGSKVGFEDGSEAEVDPVGLAPPLNAAAKGPIYAPSFQSLSLFRIGENGLVHPKVFVGHPIGKVYAAKPEKVLIDDVVDLVEKNKEKTLAIRAFAGARGSSGTDESVTSVSPRRQRP